MKQNAKPNHGKEYRILHAIKPELKKEVDRLVGIGVLPPNKDSKWAAPFSQYPKRNVLSDLKRIHRKPYPLPHIRDLFDSIGVFVWATVVDLSMGYYHVLLSKESRDKCTIILPWGKYCYNSFLMGFAGSTDIFRHAISSMFLDLPQVLCYLDDLIVIGSNSF